MAERKKVQKINPKQAPKKATAPKKQSAKPSTKPKAKKPVKRVKQTEQKIVMRPEVQEIKKQKPIKNTKPVKSASKPKPQSQKRVAPPNRTRPARRPMPSAGELFSVVLGTKQEVRRKRLITSVIAFVVILSVLVFCLTSPTGPIERITNSFALIGGGDFPANISGSETLAFKNYNEKSFLLSNSHLMGYNSSGKEFINFQHDFSNPVLETSDERILIYNRESNGFIVANNSNILFEESLPSSIYCATIGKNGSMAFVTATTSYAAQILVFSSSMKQYYSWYLADGLITDIALSNNGDYVAVSVLKVKNGIFASEIYCLDTDEENPIFVKEIKDESVVELEVISSGEFMYISNESTAIVDWDSGEILKVGDQNLSPSYFKATGDGALAVYSEAALSQVYLFDSWGDTDTSFEYNGIIEDITFFDETFFILSGNQISVLDILGKQTAVITLTQKPSFIIGVDEKGVLASDNLHINYCSVNEK